MNDDKPESLDRLAQGFARLPNVDVPPGLEGRILHSLLNAGVLRRTPHRVWPRLVGLGVALVLFGAGLGIGAQFARPRRIATTTREPQYLLLLYSGAGPQVEDVAAHRHWASDLAAHGHAIYGERLDAFATRIEHGVSTTAAPADTLLAGFFIVSAPSANVAETIAASSPHARHGGRVVMYRIRPT
jgi:hypothetical protein